MSSKIKSSRTTEC